MITIFADLETIPKDGILHDEAWARKAAKHISNKKEMLEPQEASLDPCFGQILSIVASAKVVKDGKTKWLSFGKVVDTHQVIAKYFPKEEAQPASEAELLQWFIEFVDLVCFTANDSTRFCAHNGKGFDYSFLALRLLANSIPLPKYLQVAGKKPWDIYHLDTMEDFKMGSYNSHSQDALCNLLGIPTPKDDTDGSQVWSVYLENLLKKDKKHASALLRILEYCKKDVSSLIQICIKAQQLGVRNYF